MGKLSPLSAHSLADLSGLPGEHTQYLQADHRRLVKFESVEDPNYNILLRCFNTTIEAIEKNSKSKNDFL